MSLKMGFTFMIVATTGLFTSSAALATEVKSSVLRIENLKTESSYASHYFGRIPVHSMRSVEFYIRNTGEQEMILDNAYIGGPFFDARHNCDLPLKPQEKCFVEIRYWPAFEGLHHGRLDMLFNNKEDVHIDLMGEAFRF